MAISRNTSDAQLLAALASRYGALLRAQQQTMQRIPNQQNWRTRGLLQITPQLIMQDQRLILILLNLCKGNLQQARRLLQNLSIQAQRQLTALMPADLQPQLQHQQQRQAELAAVQMQQDLANAALDQELNLQIANTLQLQALQTLELDNEIEQAYEIELSDDELAENALMQLQMRSPTLSLEIPHELAREKFLTELVKGIEQATKLEAAPLESLASKLSHTFTR